MLEKVISENTLHRWQYGAYMRGCAVLLSPRTWQLFTLGVTGLAVGFAAYHTHLHLNTAAGHTAGTPAQRTAAPSTSPAALSLAPLANSAWFGTSQRLAAQSLEQKDVVIETTLNLTLKGTILGDSPHAIIQNNADNALYVRKQNREVLPGVTIEQVERRKVVLNNNGQLENLSLPGYEFIAQLSGDDTPDETVTLSANSTPTLKPTLQKEAPYQLLYERPIDQRQRVSIEKASVLSAVANLGKLSREARFIPRKAGATTEGFKIMNLQNDSLLRRLSLQEGDILLKLDDVLIRDRENLFPLLMNMGTAQNAELLLHRSGKNIALKIEVQ